MDSQEAHILNLTNPTVGEETTVDCLVNAQIRAEVADGISRLQVGSVRASCIALASEAWTRLILTALESLVAPRSRRVFHTELV